MRNQRMEKPNQRRQLLDLEESEYRMKLRLLESTSDEEICNIAAYLLYMHGAMMMEEADRTGNWELFAVGFRHCTTGGWILMMNRILE